MNGRTDKATQKGQKDAIVITVGFDPKKKLILSADASLVGIGGVLSHKMENGSEKLFASISHTFTVEETKHSQLEK